MDIREFETRKRDHIREALSEANQTRGLSRMEEIHLIHEALPELNFEEITLDSFCLTRPARTPFYIAGMTAGHADAPQLNRILALACQKRGWAMGVGSQRRELETSLEEANTPDLWADLRAEVPHLMLFANIGISQILNAKIADVRRVVDSIRANALCVHVNAMQEAIQPGGTPQFRGGISALRRLCSEIGVPVVLKETGCGFSRATLERIADVGLTAVDVSGLGGTHWGRIEGARAAEGSAARTAAQTFGEWGESTVDSVIAARAAFAEGAPNCEIWASGGVRSGLDSAKLLALGAHRVGYAKPALEAALQGPEVLERWMERQEFELKVALLCTGNASPEALRRKEGMWIRKIS